MLKTIFELRIKLSLGLILFIVGCNAKRQNDGKSVEAQQLADKNENIVTTSLENSEYKLVVKTMLSTDTIDNTGNTNYSSTILDQRVFFYINDQLIGIYKLPIKYVTKQTTNKKSLQILETPVYQICLTKTDGIDYYLVYGSDYCSGSNCLKFLGIYSMSGAIIYEAVSTEQQNQTLKEILTKHGIDINNHAKCSQVDIFH